MWKVRFLNDDGDLAEAEFSGTLAELAVKFADVEVIVAQRPVPAKPAAGPGDAAQGESSIEVAKG